MSARDSRSEIVHSQHLIPIMVDDLYGNLAGVRSLEGTALGSVEVLPGVLAYFCFECFRELLVGPVSAGEVRMTDQEALTVVVGVHKPAGISVGYPLINETEVTRRFRVRGVDHEIVDDDLFHAPILSAISAPPKKLHQPRL